MSERTIDPATINDGCDACGAEPGEPCRPGCIGQAAAQDDATPVTLLAVTPYTGRRNGRPYPSRWTIFAPAGTGGTRNVGEVWRHGTDDAATFSTYLTGHGATLRSHPTVEDALAERGYRLAD